MPEICLNQNFWTIHIINKYSTSCNTRHCMKRMLYYLEIDKEVHCVSLFNQLEAISTNAESLAINYWHLAGLFLYLD